MGGHFKSMASDRAAAAGTGAEPRYAMHRATQKKSHKAVPAPIFAATGPSLPLPKPCTVLYIVPLQRLYTQRS